MFQNFLPTITALFAGEGVPREPVKFSWRLIRRRGRPFLLLPDATADVSVDLELYSAQRPLAQLWTAVIPWLFQTPARNFFGIVKVEADASSGLMQFLALQSGIPAGQLRSPAIKFGGVSKKTSRLVLLLCDATGHPIRVIKMGLNPEGRAVTEREADILAELPKGLLGCTTMTGFFQNGGVSAFATSYFPGKSLSNDVGIEKLFHAWLVPGAPEAIENLASWQELETAAAPAEPQIWPVLRASLAGQRLSPTLFHGDFTPWNVRMTNLENIEAFDWERGHLRGLPAWDWFHFIVQTAILVHRHSAARVAAELDQLIQSPRFQKYAAAAGISQIIEPLLLAYLLHVKRVVQPLEGGAIIGELFDLLWLEWQLGKPPAPAGRQIAARSQVRSSFDNLANLFWEPTLSPRIRPRLSVLLHRHWLALFLSAAWIIGIANLPLITDPHLMFAPFYLVPAIILALRTDRRLATIVAQAGAITGPVIFYYARPDVMPGHVIFWNTIMRMLIFQIVVMLFDRIGRQSILRRQPYSPSGQPPIAAIAGNWPVILLTIVFFAIVVLMDILTNPSLLLMPFYMLPCMILTLALNWRWGTIAALIAAIVGPLLQRPDPAYQPLAIEFWNTAMRFVIYELVVVLLERVRRESILFHSKNRH